MAEDAITHPKMDNEELRHSAGGKEPQAPGPSPDAESANCCNDQWVLFGFGFFHSHHLVGGSFCATLPQASLSHQRLQVSLYA